MPIEAQRLVTRFEGDDKPLDRTFRSVEQKTGQHLTKVENLYRHAQGRINAVSSAGGGLLPGLASISEIIQGIPQIGRLAGGLVRPLTDAAEEGIRLNMVLETAQIGFEGVAGGADKAKSHIAALMAFGQKSPFRFEGLLEASRFMTAFGFSLDEQIPKLTVWGNAIAASGELSESKIKDVVRAFGQMRTAGRVNAQDMNQLTNANIPGWELLAKAIGKTVAETRKLSEAGKLEGGQAVEAITAMMQTDPRYKDMMKRMEATGAGRLSAAQDVLQFAQAKATTNLTKDISETLGAALQKQNLVGELAGSINTAIAPVSGLIRTAAMSVLGGGLTSGLIEGIQAGKDAVKQAVGDFALDGIIGTAKGWLGIESPSTVFYDMGLMSAQGFALGLQDGFKENPLVEELRKLLEDPRVRAFMEAIKKAEGGAPNRIVGHGGTFSDFSKHPNKVGIVTDKGPSTAAGSFQITGTTWRGVSKALGLPDFSEPSQILAALELFRRTGGVKKLQQGDFAGAVKAAGHEWQSLPGSSLGGKYHVSQEKFQGLYNQALMSMSFGGQEVSQSHPLPVTFAGVTGGVSGPLQFAEQQAKVVADLAVAIEAAINASRRPGEGASAQRFGGEASSSFGGAKFTDIEWTETKARAVVSSFKEAEKQALLAINTANTLTGSILPRALDGTNALGEAALQTAQAFQQGGLAAGAWGEKVILQTESLRTRLEGLKESLPSVSEEFSNILFSLPQRFGDIFGEAVRQWDGTFKGFLHSLGQGLQQTLADIAAQLAQSAVTKLLVNLGLIILGSAAGAGGAGLGIPGGPKLGGVSINPFARAGGGPVSAGLPYLVHKDEWITPNQNGMVYNKQQQAEMSKSYAEAMSGHRLPRGSASSVSQRRQEIHYNFNNTFNLDIKGTPNSYAQKQSGRQVAEQIASLLQSRLS